MRDASTSSSAPNGPASTSAIVVVATASRRPPAACRAKTGSKRLESLAAVAEVQTALASARSQTPPSGFKPSDFTIYIQYPEGGGDEAKKAQDFLLSLGYRVPGIEQVSKPPSRIQVRYYRLDQKTLAGHLAAQLGQALGLQASADNAILVTSSRELPSGILEVWLPG